MNFHNNEYIRDIILRQAPPPASYLNQLPVVQFLKEKGHLPLHSPVTFLVGENGTGKSTLLEAVAVAAGFNAEGGTRNFHFATRETHSELCDCITLAKHDHPKDGFFLRAESFYNVATNIDDMDDTPSFSPPIIESYGGQSLHRQSHGESFLSVVQHRFSGNGLYLLDEPEAALSPMRLLVLLAEMDALVKNGSQLILSTHSPILMAYPGAEIYELSSSGIASVNYKDTQHYQLTRRFLNAPEKMLHELLNR